MSTDSKFHVKRHDDREVFDRDAVNTLLDNQYVAHVGFIDPDLALKSSPGVSRGLAPG